MMNWQFFPCAFPLFMGAVLLVIAVIPCWRRRAASTAAGYMVLTNILVAVYVAAYGMELGQTTVGGVLFWSKVEYVGFMPAIATLFMLAAAYTNKQHWLTNRNRLLLLVVPVLSIAFAWTNEWHEWLWQDMVVVPTGPLFLADFTAGSWYWINVGYLYLVMVASMVLLARTYFKVPRLYRRQIALILTGMAVPLAVHLFYLIGLAAGLDLLGINWQAYAFIVTALVLSWGISNYQLFDLAPVAHEAIFESMDDSAIVIDNQNRIVDVNPAAERMLGWARAEVTGVPVTELLADYQKDAVEAYVDAREAQVEFEVGRRVYDMRVSPLYQRGKQLTGRLIVLRDITGRKKAAQQKFALELEKERVQILSRFITKASHEFRTPLTIIRTSTHLIKNLTAPADRERHIDAINLQVDSISKLVDNLTTMSTLDSAQQLPMKDVDLNEVVRTAGEAVQSAQQKAGLRGCLELTQGPLWVRGDFHYLTDAIKSIWENAIHYSPPGGAITVRSRGEHGDAVVEVTDTGDGINDDVLPHIFERFYRADAAGTTRGFGLGLPIAQAIVEKHRGRIEVKTATGQGSTFRIFLPHCDQGQAPI